MTGLGSMARRLVAVALLVLAVGACGRQERPTLGAWRATWERATAIVPSEDDVGATPDRELCESTLGELREVRPDLTPAPDEVVNAAVEEWITYAESVFFSCFEEVSGDDPVAAAYEQLDRLEGEVDAAIGSAPPD
jgi:hypothetical protein